MAHLGSILEDDPFSDRYAEPVLIYDSNHDEDALAASIRSVTLHKPRKHTVPILDPLPPQSQWSSPSSSSTASASTAPSSPAECLATPIEWTNEDIMYLLTILHPNLPTSSLIFQPPLSHLPHTHPPIHLQLSTSPPASIPRTAYAATQSIGTGRPQPRTLVATSSPSCQTPRNARRSLALALLSDHALVSSTLDRYNVLYTLYSSPTTTLRSLYRGMIEMLGVSEQEWMERAYQLRGHVDGVCTLEARLEHFLLGLGRDGIVEWVEIVEGAVEVGEDERRSWGRVYGDAARFLGRCC